MLESLLPPVTRPMQNSWAARFRSTFRSLSSDRDPSLRTERLWQDYFTDPSLDNRMNKKMEAEKRESQRIDEGKASDGHVKQGQSCSKSEDPSLATELAGSGSVFKPIFRSEVQQCLGSGRGFLDEGDDIPSIDSIICMLQKCRKAKRLAFAKRVHAYICNNGLESHKAIGNYIVPMFVECGSISDAQQVFNRLVYRNEHSWTSLILGYIECGQPQRALNLYQKMQDDSVHPSFYTLTALLKACGRLKDVERGRQIHVEIAQRAFDRDAFVGNTLVDMYAKCGLLAEAQRVFDRLTVRDTVSWTALIAGYAEHGPGQEGLKCFEQMQLKGISPDAVTFVCALKACGNTGAIDKGQEIHTDIAQKGFERDISVGNTLVDMYAKCGSLLEAREVFDKLPVRDVVSWNAMIKGYGMNHRANMAVQCFEDMQQQGVRPDDITFTCLLTSCSRARLVFKGQEFFNRMRDRYGIAPTRDHYTCMVDLLAQSGNLYEAENFVKIMPCFPSWIALLNACKTYGEAELGHKCFQQLVQMDPGCAAPYMLMGRIYATAGRWDDAFRIDEMRKQAGARKKPATALIEVNKKVHEFVVGNNLRKELSSMLEVLNSRMEDEGHVPNVSLVLRSISDREKEDALCEHAEKLAIAFGLLNTAQGQTLRVTKNMRMCNDCHNMSRIVSKIERREIIVRDGYHIHHFKDGLCSCGDMC